METTDTENKNQSSLLEPASSFIWDLSKVFILCFVIVIFTRYYIFQPFVVSGNSMEPNFSHGDYLIIDEISYRLGQPERGDVVVLRFPQDPSQFLIKRVVGLPGERVVISEGKVKIYQKDSDKIAELKEEYLLPTTPTQGNQTYDLGVDEYFVLGDNRTASSDSRSWGTLERKNIIGKVWVRVLPITEAAFFNEPEYNLP